MVVAYILVQVNALMNVHDGVKDSLLCTPICQYALVWLVHDQC